MPKVVITGLKTRTMAKDHKNVAPIHKPASKPGVLAAIMRPPLTRGDTSPVGKPTQTDTRRK
jgi:hypothetical protein